MKVGVIGTGAMGRNHVRTYADLRGVEYLGVTDVDVASGKEAAKRHNAEFVPTLDALLKKVEAVSLCVPTKFHFEVAKKVMEAGIPCLIEKPIAMEAEEGRKLEKIRERAGVIAGVGHIERFNPLIPEIKKLIPDPYYVEINRHNPTSGRRTDTDVITDLMVHDLDLVWNFLLKGKKGSVLSASGFKRASIDFAVSLLRFDNCTALLSANRMSSKKIRQISMEDWDKTVVGNLMSQELFVYYKPSEVNTERLKYRQENRMEQVTVSKIEPLREELRTFLKCVKEDNSFPVTLEEASMVLEVADRIRVVI
jgi:predicted dehydrogenase